MRASVRLIASNWCVYVQIRPDDTVIMAPPILGMDQFMSTTNLEMGIPSLQRRGTRQRDLRGERQALAAQPFVEQIVV